VATNNKRLVNDGIAKISTAPSVVVKINIPTTSNEIFPNCGTNCIEYEFTAMLNGGEQVRAKFADPHFTMYKNFIGNSYFHYSRNESLGPVDIESLIRWGAVSELRTATQSHALVTMAPSGVTNTSEIELLAVDYPSYFLAAGDAGGGSYQGNVASVIRQVVQKYGKGRCNLEFDADTRDNKFNRWWQLRMDPKTFILSLLDWTTSLSDNQTRWFLYPDASTLIIKEQASVESKQRATYEWRGFGGGSDKRPGDILEWEFIGDNALQMLNNQMVTSGMSSVSGEYFDRSTHKQKMDVVFIGDEQTPNKYKPQVDNTGKIGTSTRLWRSYDKPSGDGDPLSDVVGWTGISSIPEFSAGDLGLRYRDFIDGRARGAYLSSCSTLLRMRFRVMGHHIWSGSEGLGADTIYITLTSSQKGAPPYFVAGNWIVYGFTHTYHPESWVTDLYCYRLDKDATAVAVGKGA
jgi:hypothetical protein